MAGIPCCSGSGVGPAATALIRPLAWEPPYASGSALEKTKRKKKKKILELEQLQMMTRAKV